MANALFDVYRNNILGDATFANIQLDSDDIIAAFIDTADDDPSTSTDQDFADISTALVPAFASCPTLASKTIGSVGVGVFDATDTTFTALTGDQVEELVIGKDTGTDTTSPLIAVFDTFGSGMPLTPNGGDVTVQWNASGIFSI